MMVSDFAAGVQNVDFFASAFIRRGGSIAQEQYSALGTNDFGPYLGQLNKSADIIHVFLPGVDIFNESSQDPGTQQLVKAWQAAFPNRILSHDCAEGYMSGQVLSAALEKVNGQVEDTNPFLQALYRLGIDTAKGPVHLDQTHDIVQDVYIYRIEKNGSSVATQGHPDLPERLRYLGSQRPRDLHLPLEQAQGPVGGHDQRQARASTEKPELSRSGTNDLASTIRHRVGWHDQGQARLDARGHHRARTELIGTISFCLRQRLDRVRRGAAELG